MLRLLKAHRTAYSEIKRLQLGFELLALIIVLALPFTYIFLPELKTGVGIIGALLSIVAIAIDRIQKRRTKAAASIQEKFDRTLFELDENVYDRTTTISTDEIIALADRYEGGDPTNWYSQKINVNIPHNMAVLLCQKANLNWDASLRKKYRAMIWVLLLIYSVGTIYTLAVTFNDTNEFLLHTFFLLVGGAAFFKYCIGVILEKGDIINEKNDLSKLVDKHFQEYKISKVQPSICQLSHLQSKIFIARTKTVKIPSWFYRMFKSEDEKTMNQMTQGIIEDYL
jgi:hypothetical protein